ncbi:rubredoxin-like domain-containing protein [Tannockella kyphosi]|uniref:rubredoxin-like domain-containing protein n=1 Tax=Tannockella kyphosi TaxID=2899121 RepID=UPI0020116704|nr:4Fe-4S binding protein [Tannockella kyphosi]
MSKSYAVRNIALCTKDCLCLYVCPTGAADTENSIIDMEKCIGCGACANACPSRAISLVPREFPPQQRHDDEVLLAMNTLLSSKANQENIASTIDSKLAKAIEKSNRIMAEDIIREAGYMLPQSANTRTFLESQVDNPDIKEIVTELMSLIQPNEKVVTKEIWTCSICGYIHTGEMSPDFTCPLCKQPASAFTKS